VSFRVDGGLPGRVFPARFGCVAVLADHTWAALRGRARGSSIEWEQRRPNYVLLLQAYKAGPLETALRLSWPGVVRTVGRRPTAPLAAADRGESPAPSNHCPQNLIALLHGSLPVVLFACFSSPPGRLAKCGLDPETRMPRRPRVCPAPAPAIPMPREGVRLPRHLPRSGGFRPQGPSPRITFLRKEKRKRLSLAPAARAGVSPCASHATMIRRKRTTIRHGLPYPRGQHPRPLKPGLDRRRQVSSPAPPRRQSPSIGSNLQQLRRPVPARPVSSCHGAFHDLPPLRSDPAVP